MSKLYSVVGDQLGSVRAFLDTTWPVGHMLSTRMIIAMAYPSPEMPLTGTTVGGAAGSAAAAS
eukprot:5430657-Amphidinium_carterae.2